MNHGTRRNHVRNHFLGFAGAIAVGVVCSSYAHADDAPPKVGDPAPPLALAAILQAPDDASAAWEDLTSAGNVVVLEFWTTWCGPCIAAIPHLNELAETFADRPVTFISITNEEPDIVRSFLERREMKSWVGIDDDDATFKAYNVSGIPHTVIVNNEGMIAGITYPTQLTVEVLEDALAGRELDLPDRPTGGMTVRAGIDPLANGEAPPPLFQVLIREDEEDLGGTASWSQHEMTMTGMTVRSIVPRAWEISSSYVANLDLLEDNETTYTVIVRTPSTTRSMMSELLQAALEATFGITGEFEPRETDVFVLQLPNDGEHRLIAAEDEVRSSGWSASGFEGVGIPLSSVLPMLESILRMPVLNETGLEGRFDYRLLVPQDIRTLNDEDRAQAIIEAVREHLGLALHRQRREVDMLIISRRENAAAAAR